ncbi:MAG: nitroreductase family deazaflavin-dependent oxidoreductase [Candidatus Dormibacteraeota bacterium]|nr:nitroreductase family deazaflavin-dependent oxidoreductase [Candidatus Dormibacteraeota bacterium]
MDQKIMEALSRGHVIDMTTTGRKTGQPRRIEIVFHNIGGRLYISGQPRPEERAWLANLEANPHFTLHLKGAVKADVPATARIINDPDERHQVLTEVAKIWKRNDVDKMVEQSPLIEVTVGDKAA